MKKEINLRKINIVMMLDLLETLFEQGYDYFDVEAVEGEEQDFIKIFIKPEYLSKDVEECFDEYPRSLSDEDLNQLL